MDTLFYDGQCPLCQKEIALLRKLQRGSLVFADIHQQENRRGGLQSRENLLRRLHLRTSTGAWKVGLPANVHAWSHTRYGWLFAPLLWPGVNTIARWVYERWADRRYLQRYACGACSIDTCSGDQAGVERLRPRQADQE